MMAKYLIASAVFSLILGAAAIVLYLTLGANIFLVLAITFLTTFYHLAVRLLSGKLWDFFSPNNVNCRRPWFRPHPWEKSLYRALRVKRWKNRLPTYYPASFSPEEHSWEEILQASCHAELVHETNILLSYVPLFAVPRFGALPAFLITSVLSSLIDLAYTLIQRYNRPRLLAIVSSPNP